LDEVHPCRSYLMPKGLIRGADRDGRIAQI